MKGHLHAMFPLIVFPVLSLLAFLPASSGHLAQVVGDDLAGAAAELPRVYIIHVRKPQHLLSAGPEQVEEWHRSFLPSPALDTGEERLVFSYNIVMSGFAARLTAQEVITMRAKEGFLHAQPDEDVDQLTTHTPDFLGLRSRVWGEANGGEGAIIGVVDTGISPGHASFRGDRLRPHGPAEWNGWCYFNNTRTCNDKLVGAKYYELSNKRILPPYDDGGHGTHVAGTVAGVQVQRAGIHGYAPGTAAGAAPGAYLAVYKSTTGAETLWSIEQAIKDGVHVLSISLGIRHNGRPPPPFYMNNIAVGALSAVRHGILVSCSACNDGPRPSTVCNDAPWIMTVGASTMGRTLLANLKLGNGGTIPGETVFNKNGLSADLAYPGANGDPKLGACTTLSGANVTGKVVMCYRGGTTAADKAKIIQREGGIAMVQMNTDRMGSIITEIPDVSIPTVAVNHANALRLIEYVATAGRQGARVQLNLVGTVIGLPPFPAIPAFSSRGPSLVNGGILKPDIVGPGVNILAAKVNSSSEFTLKSGTSMSTPLLSGVAAIIKQYQRQRNGKDWTPAMIRSAIMTTSETSNRQGRAITDQTDRPAGLFATGAGHVNPAGALDPGLVYDLHFDDYVRYLCGLGYTDDQVYLTSGATVKCGVFGKILPEQLNYPSISVTLSEAQKTKTVTRTAASVLPRTSTYEPRVSFNGSLGVVINPTRLTLAALGNSTFNITFFTVYPVQPGQVIQGRLQWFSASHVVTSPLLVTME